MDRRVEGINKIDAILNKIGLDRAGSGQTLDQARAPAYFQTALGPIAMIPAASSFLPMSRVVDAGPDFKGRPRLSALRKIWCIYLEPLFFDQLRSVTLNNFRGGRPPTVQPPADKFNFFGASIRRGLERPAGVGGRREGRQGNTELGQGPAAGRSGSGVKYPRYEEQNIKGGLR